MRFSYFMASSRPPHAVLVKFGATGTRGTQVARFVEYGAVALATVPIASRPFLTRVKLTSATAAGRLPVRM